MTILIVDDERLVLLDSKDIIESVLPDAEILLAENYKEALHHAQKHIDIAFLDIEMPYMNGMSVATELQKQQPDINIVFLTGYSQYALDAYKLKASDYLLKPISPKDVEHAIACLRSPISMATIEKQPKTMDVVCFGRFTVFCDGKPIRFKRDKAKEIFAYLVAKRGVGVSVEQLCDVLWPENGNKQQYCWKLISELRMSLKNYGLEEVIVHNLSEYSVDVSRITCDYYDYLDGKTNWNNVFMEQYSLWVEPYRAKLELGDLR